MAEIPEPPPLPFEVDVDVEEVIPTPPTPPPLPAHLQLHLRFGVPLDKPIFICRFRPPISSSESTEVPNPPPLPLWLQTSPRPIRAQQQTHRRTMASCGVCGDEVENSSQSWMCSSNHTCCLDCLRQYITSKLTDYQFKIKCPGIDCEYRVPESIITNLLEPNLLALYQRRRRLHENQNLRECPSCQELVEGSSSSPALTCACGQAFCFFHGLEHAGRKCVLKQPSIVQRAKNAIWTARHTKKCPKCKHYIEKNGGCNHMTCRCGHEICWMCGKDYRKKNGAVGHLDSLFPSPSQLGRCCNDWKMWSKRVGVAAAALPVAAAVVSLGLPAFGVYKGGVAVQQSWRRYQYLKNFGRLHNSEMCAGYYQSINQSHDCRHCSRAMRCLQHTYNLEEDPFLCTRCGHWTLHDNACAHFFSHDTAPCTFCNRTQAQISQQTEMNTMALLNVAQELLPPPHTVQVEPMQFVVPVVVESSSLTIEVDGPSSVETLV